MIISASYKTDIPAFYGDWFLNRLNAGYCRVVNPYSHRVSNISLKREDVDGFVFWSKNISKFMEKLDIIHQRGFPFMLQYTIHNYPCQLESSIEHPERSFDHMQLIANTYGPRVAVWRYDPIIFTSLTPLEFHLENFEDIARRLEGTTDEVVISFAQFYKKTFNNINLASKNLGFHWFDPDIKTKFNLAADLAKIAKKFNMQLTMCSQKDFLAQGVMEARCVDARRLSDVAGYPIRAKLKGNRPECGCYQSADIGEYDTCPHGCVYCYAVRDRIVAQKRYREHDKNGEFLCAPKEYVENQESKSKNDKTQQRTLF